jgi:hypothetical protein
VTPVLTARETTRPTVPPMPSVLASPNLSFVTKRYVVSSRTRCVGPFPGQRQRHIRKILHGHNAALLQFVDLKL